MRRLIVFVMLAGALAASAAPAAATDNVRTLSDPQGDVDRPRGDIVQARLVHLENRIVVSMELAELANPATHPSWDHGYTWATWFLDVGGKTGPEYSVIVHNGLEGRLWGTVNEVRDGPDHEICNRQAAYDIKQRTMTFNFLRLCIESPERVRFWAQMDWDTDPSDPGTRVQIDRAKGEYANDTYSKWATFPY